MNKNNFQILVCIVSGDSYSSYREISFDVKDFFIKNEVSRDKQYKYLKDLISYYNRNYEKNIKNINMPDSTLLLLKNEIIRIREEISTNKVEFYSVDNDLYLKDLGISRLKLIPFGAELADLSSGVPRSIIFKGGAKQFFLSSYYFLFHFKGFKPYLQLHLDPRNLNEFTPEGWEKTYFRLAEFLELNPEYKGFYGASWFYDPALDHISPHLSYLRTIREAGGAKLFRWGAEDDVKGMALEKSSARREHYRKGQYRPCSYFIVWGRRELISWAEKGGNI